MNNFAQCTMEEFIFNFVDFIWEVDINGVYTYAAGDCEHLLGYTANEIIGKTPFDFMPEEDVEKITLAFGEIIKNRSDIVDLINWNIRKDGSRVCLLTSGKPFYSDQGVFLGYRGIDKDVTQEHLKDAELQKRLDALIKYADINAQSTQEIIKESLEIAAYTLNIGRASFWDYKHEYIECLNLFEKESKTHSNGAILHKKDFPRYFASVEGRESIVANEARTDLRTSEFTQEYLIPNDIYAMLDVPVFKKNKLIGVICLEHLYTARTFHENDVLFVSTIANLISKALMYQETQVLKDKLDIEKRKLSFTNKNLQLSLDAANAGTFLLDIENNIVQWDKNSLDMFGVTEENFAGNYQAWLNFIDENEIHTINEKVKDQLENEDKIDIRYCVNANNKTTKHIWAIGTIIRDENGMAEYVTGLHFDETEKIKLNSALKEAKNRAVEASMAKSSFLSSMSHEIRTPLNAILGFTSLVEKEKSLSATAKTNLNIIHNSSLHLLEVINQILDISKIEAGKLELNSTDFNLKILLDDVYNMVKNPIEEKHLSFYSHYELENTLLYSDSSKIKQVLINLLGNAIKFTDKGSITLNVNTRKINDTTTKVIFEIKDTGKGIQQSKQELIFEPFAQVNIDDQNYGTGLGLAISKNIITLLDGEISLESALNKGTSFHIEILCQNSKQTLKQTPLQEVKTLTQAYKGTKVLVVDDISVNRLLMSVLLSEVGFDVSEATNGLEAIQMVKTDDFKLIWMDIKMPIMDGIEASGIIKKSKLTQAPIIALSANVIEQNERQENCPFDDFLCKPFENTQMFELIRQHIKVEYEYE